MADRDVLIRIRTEILKAEGTPPDLEPLVKAQERVKESAQAATEALTAQGATGGDALDRITEATHRELDALAATVEAWRVAEGAARDYGNLQLKPEGGGDIPAMKEEETAAVDRHTAALREEADARMDAQVAAAVEATEREKAVGVILQEEQAVKHASEAHESHGRSLAGLARPMTMVIHSAMSLAHSMALLTAANGEDAEAMTRKLMVYEGWIMGATGALHMIHALHRGYEILEKQAWLAAIAEGLALSPLAAIVAGVAAIAAVGIAIWGIGDAFDAWGSHAKRAADEMRELSKILDGAVKAARDFNKEKLNAEFSGFEKKQEILAKTDAGHRPVMGDAVKNEIDAERQILAGKEKVNDEATEREKARHKKERDDLKSEREEEFKNSSFMGKSGGLLRGIFGDKKDFEKETEAKLAQLELEQQEKLKTLASEKLSIAEKQAALEQMNVANLAAQRDHLRENLKTQQDIVRAAEQALKAAEQAQKAADTNFGGLDEAKQMELARINEKVKRGEKLNVNERQHVRQFGGKEGGEFVDEEERQLGVLADRAGKTSHLKGPGKAGVDDQVKSDKSQLEEARREMGALTKELDKKETELRAAGKSAMTAVDKVTKTTTDLINSLIAKIEELTKTLEAMRNNKPR